MEIREVVISELRAVAARAHEFYEDSAVLRVFCDDRFIAFWAGLITSGNGVIFALFDGDIVAGGIGAVAHPEPYSGELIAQEFFWFVGKAYRAGIAGIRLYGRLELWTRGKGCAELRMAHLVDSMPEKLAAFYERSGYSKIETLYAKRLDASRAA